MADDKIIDFAAKMAEGISSNKKADSKQSVVSVGLKPQQPEVNVIKDGKVVKLAQDDVDPQQTVNVKNPELEELIDKFTEEKTNENLTALINRLEISRVLLPGKLMGENKTPVPLTVNTSEGDIIQPIFTDKEKMEKAPKCEVIINIPFVVVLATVLDKGPEIAGIGINPFSKAVILKRELLEKIMEVVKKKAQAIKRVDEIKAAGVDPSSVKIAAQVGDIMPGAATEKVTNPDGTVTTKVKLSEEQYAMFERSRFEFAYLPGKLKSEGQEFINALADGREEYVDSLFEDAYAEKRMYPYLANEFKVMFMGISEELDVVTISMPTADIVPGNAETIYMAWNKKTNSGRYFAIVKGNKKNTRDAVEVIDNKPNFLGEAPDEGTEINWLMDKLNEGSEA